jgi:hypothetical protein
MILTAIQNFSWISTAQVYWMAGENDSREAPWRYERKESAAK